MRRSPSRVAAMLAALATVGAVSAAPAAGAVPADPTANVVSGPTVVQKLGRVSSPATAESATAQLGSPATPYEDLIDALDAMALASDTGAAGQARQRVLDILEGNPVAGAVYSGIPLLNWNAPAKVQHVAAGGQVVVREVRFGDHLLSDTWLLDFEDPALPFTITYRIAELDGNARAFAPAVMTSADTGPTGGRMSALVPLDIAPMATGTFTTNRFNPAPGGEERVRTGVQDVTVQMPAPRTAAAILDLDVRPDRPFLAALQPATAVRLATVARDFGFSGSRPSTSEKRSAITRLSDRSPERLLWSDLDQLDPHGPSFVDNARRIAVADRQLVGAMRTRSGIANGIVAPGDADLVVALANNSASVSSPSVRLAPGATMSIAVVNADHFAHQVDDVAVFGRRPVFGPLDWGAFNWTAVSEPGAATDLAPGETRVFTITPPTDAFGLLVGDFDSGDQARVAVTLDRGADRQSFHFQPDFAAPTHDAQDANGDMWVTLAGVDKVARITPTADLAHAPEVEYLLPGGAYDLASPNAPLVPLDIKFDAHGIAWVSLVADNSIARIDPTRVHAGTSDGITRYELAPCDTCPPKFPPGPPAKPSRGPGQMVVGQDSAGATVLWIAEPNANAIGRLRVAPDGALLARADFACECTMPTGIDTDRSGQVWFTEFNENRIGTLHPDAADPDNPGAAHLDHFNIPSFTQVQVPQSPEHGGGPLTSGPHSLLIDHAGRVWFTEETNRRIGVLDPTQARVGTSAGFTEYFMGDNDFSQRIAPADLAVDSADTVYWADEYGDAVGTITTAGPGRRWRPTARQSLTDKPVIDGAGNLWFSELGANLLTRITGASNAGRAAVRRPSSPTAVSATPGSASVVAHWTPPSDTGGAPLMSYRITVLASDVSVVTQLAAASATSSTVSGLAEGTEYTVRVAATNSAGSGPAAVATATTPATRLSGAMPTGGYRLVASDGGIFAFGDAAFHGSTGAIHLNQPIVGMTSTPSGRGYWLVARDGGIFAFGDAAFHGSTGAIHLNQPIVGMTSTPTGNGYWLVARDGGMFAFGDAAFLGSMGGRHLNQPIVGMTSTPTGNGYWLVARDGGMFAFGGAAFLGSMGGRHLNSPIVGMAASPSGRGYWLVAQDGGMFAFGDAGFFGSTGAIHLNQPIIAMTPTRSGRGYWLVARDGGIFAFGDAQFLGSTGDLHLNQPIVGMAAR